MNEKNPVIERYISAFDAALQQYDLPERREIVSDVRSHIDEALQYGKPLDEVLQSLGPAEALARAYAVELKMNPKTNGAGQAIGRFFGVLGILSFSGLVSFIVVTTLGSIAISFFGSGLIVLVIGLIEATGVHLPYVQMAGIHPLLVAALGPVMMLVGYAAGWGVWRYMRAVASMLRKTLPRARAASA